MNPWWNCSRLHELTGYVFTIFRATRVGSDLCTLIDKILSRVNGVIRARESKYILLHAPTDTLNEIVALLPGAENPTVLPLNDDSNRVAIHVVSTEDLFWDTMEELTKLGASSILVMPIEKMMG